MAQINLLKQKKTGSEFGQVATSVFIKVLVIALLGLVGYYGYLFYRVRAENKEILSLQDTLNKKRQELVKNPDRDQLFTRQQQLKELQGLVAAHPYWSGLLPALAEATLKNAEFLNFHALSDGTISLSIAVPTIVDLDKFLQVFDIPEFNQNFYDLKIGSIGKTQIGDGLFTTVELKMKYNPALLQFKKQ